MLAGIGRKHSAQDILDCYAEARKAGHDDINMDLIAGLPGDTVEKFERSLRQAIALDPENITVHTLTLKRASRIVIEDQKENDYADVAAMLEKSAICWPRRVTGPTTSTARRILCRTWKTWAGASRATRDITTSISWRKSRPSSPPVQAAAPSWWPTAENGCSAFSILSIRTNISSVLRRCWNAKKEWLIFMITIWVPKRLVEIDLYNVAARSPQALADLSEQSYAQSG